jgi:AAA ATPase domain/AAA domain, putative AbiEii toxin, Type IV TA system
MGPRPCMTCRRGRRYGSAMRITAFWARGYRSLADVRLDDLGPFNVFYGPNGAGKSNILAAMRTLFGLLAWRSAPGQHDLVPPHHWVPYDSNTEFLHLRDRCNLQQVEPMILGARVARTARNVEVGDQWDTGTEFVCEVHYDWFRRRLRVPMREWAPPRETPAALDPDAPVKPELDLAPRTQRLVYGIAKHVYALVDADRVPRAETLDSSINDVAAILAAGKLKESLFRASAHPNPVVRRRFKQLQELLAGPPLHRRAFVPVHDAGANTVELMENTSDSADRPTEVPLHLAGLGIAQIYSILGQALLREADVVAIEEPEAHLHAPTSGLHLRQLLHRLVTEGYLDQLFIATHSNLFDLDPTGYYDVSLDERGATRVERKPLSEIDDRHLYEPGPAKHALTEFLRFMEADAIVFRRPDGSPVSVSEMLDMLQRDDPVAVEFLRDVHGAAVRAVRVKSKKSAEPASGS